MKLVLATNNRGKIAEIEHKFSCIPDLELIPLSQFSNPPVITEDGRTFKDNAYKKAKEISAFTQMPALADDSGLVIDALDGRPGVLSARYGGEMASDDDRNMLILKEMEDVRDEHRSARFICIIAIHLTDGTCHFAEGDCEGTIARSMSGKGGFGYDPIFYLPHLGKTMAELTLDQKNSLSHRARALDIAQKILMKIQGGRR